MLTVVLAGALAVGAVSSSDVQPIVLDDATAVGTGWSQGSNSACLEDAYRGTFHSDSPSQPGHVSVVYKFDPPKDGCYVVEEHHPGQNLQCSQQLPTNARVDIDYCRGKSAYTYVDQSLQGGQWNILGALPFYKGWEGRVRVANSGTSSTCKLGSNCLWVADAFKVTYVSDLSAGCRVPADYAAEELTTTLEPTSTVTSPPETSVQTTTSTVAVSVQTLTAPASSVATAMNIVNQAVDAVQTVIDDVSANSSMHWQRSFCGAQGWMQSFMYSVIRTEAAVEFTFDPPSDGCYILEEFHPEHVCNRALSSEVSLSIHYCKGLKTKAIVDQSQNGNRWNTITALPFYKGTLGRVLVTHPKSGSAPAAADAFRFTRISSSCRNAVQPSLHYHRLAQNAAAIIVDSHHPVEAQQGLPSTCSAKALGGQLHAASSGEAEAKFEFMPTSTGCYRIDSFHPENQHEQACGLADHAALEVNWCLGKQTKMVTPLKGSGNTWNTIGHFKFYAGAKGNVISRRLSATPSGKAWVADAFRFTKVSESCDKIPNVAHFSLHIVSKALKDHIPAVLETGLTSYPDMRMALHEAVVEAMKLPHNSVHLLSIRRGSIIADFEVRGPHSMILNSLSTIRALLSPFIDGSKSTLKQVLCNTVSSTAETECDVTVMEASVIAGPPGNSEEALPENAHGFSTIWLQFGTIACSAAALLTFAFCVLACRHFKNKKVMDQPTSDVSTVHVLPKDATSPKEQPDAADKKNSAQDVYPDAEKGKIAWDEISQSGSTATPGSDPDGLQDVELYSLS